MIGLNDRILAIVYLFIIYALIAQLKEQFRPKEKVEGLSPSGSTAVWCNGLASVSLKQGVLVRIQLPPLKWVVAKLVVDDHTD